MTIQYFDSGHGGPEQCLGRWLDDELVDGVCAFRGQFGYYDGSALRKYLPTLQGMVAAGGVFRLVIGANSGDPASTEDVNALLPLVTGDGNARLAVVALSNALFHPKTLHVVRADQSVVAVVGSANLTAKGLGHNVEAGVVIESGQETDEALQHIAAAIDYWFGRQDTGVYEITEQDDIAALEEIGLVVPPSTRRRLRAASRGRGAINGRGVRAVGWHPPRMQVGEEPAEVEGEDPVVVDGGEDRTRAAITARWCKRLRNSDAQQTQQGTNPTGKLRLAQARFEIDQTTYFRDEFFGDEPWAEVDRRGTTYEEVHVPFNVERPGLANTEVILRIDHAPHRVADQHNVPTVLGWGREIGAWLRANNQSGNWVVIEKDIAGQYWMSFHDNKPDWAP